MRSHLRLGLVCVTVLLSLACGAARAEPQPVSDDSDYLPPPLPEASPITDRFYLRTGFNWGSVETTALFNPATTTGTTTTPSTAFSAEKDLGMSSHANQPVAEIGMRFGKRNRLRIDIIDLQRSAAKVINRTIQYGNTTYVINSPLQSELDWRQINVTYTYSLIQASRFELGVGAGVHGLQLQGHAVELNSINRADISGSAPFATVAADATLRLTKHLSWVARGQYLKVNIRNYSGSLGDFHSDLQYRIGRALALGAGYTWHQAQLNAKDVDPSGQVQLHISGPELFARVSF